MGRRLFCFCSQQGAHPCSSPQVVLGKGDPLAAKELREQIKFTKCKRFEGRGFLKAISRIK